MNEAQQEDVGLPCPEDEGCICPSTEDGFEEVTGCHVHGNPLCCGGDGLRGYLRREFPAP